MEIKVGDVVMLKSGGVKMAVRCIDGDFVDCDWFDGFHSASNCRFPISCLTRVPDEKGAVKSTDTPDNTITHDNLVKHGFVVHLGVELHYYFLPSYYANSNFRIDSCYFSDNSEEWLVNGKIEKRPPKSGRITTFTIGDMVCYTMEDVADAIMDLCGIELSTEYKLS